MTRRPLPLLAEPVETSLQSLALMRLEEAERAARRLSGDDPEALHDFRVALRRLRTLLRAYRDHKPVRKKWEARLRELAQTTNGARDLEVAVQNLRALRKSHDPLAWQLAERFTARSAAAREEIIHQVGESWPALSEGLQQELQRPQRESTSFATATALLVEAEAHRLERRLHALHKQWHDEEAHRARLAGKRLRYLLEPLHELPAAAPAVETLKRFQDGFGHYHDGWVLLNLVAEEAAGEAAAATHGALLGEHVAAFDPAPWQALVATLQGQRRELAAALRMTYTEPETHALSAVTLAIEALRARAA